MTEHALNAQQQRAVEHRDGPLMILAGAGAGKTRVITHRIVNLVRSGVAPEHILAVTFTNKAAKEMRERVLTLLDADPAINRPVAARATGMASPYVATFHALGVMLLRENARVLDLNRNFTIFDRADSMRIVKRAVKQLGLDPKQFEPRAVLATISRHKADGLTAGEYHADVGDVWRHSVGRIWEVYEAQLQKEDALDFDDLLLRTYLLLRDHGDVRTRCRDRWKYIHIDEYQDTNRVQFEIARLLTGPDKNICVVGDMDQCLAPDTKITMSDGSQKRIDQVRSTDMVLSNYGSGNFKPAQVTRIIKRKAPATLVRIRTTSGKEITSTPEHIHFAGYVFGVTPQLYFTYLMYKRGLGWRIGTSQTYTKGENSVIGFVQRSNQEHADATWVIAEHDTPQAARAYEYVTSLRYRIPTLPFVARKGGSTGGYVHDQEVLNGIFGSFDTDNSAHNLLDELGLSRTYPHHQPQSRNGSRKNIILTLCGDKRRNVSQHRISIVGNDLGRKRVLESLGLSVRPARARSKSWRFETSYTHWGELEALALSIKEKLPDSTIIKVARIGDSTRMPNTNREKRSLPFIPAASVRKGMVLCDERGMWDVVTSVETCRGSNSYVYDLNVAQTHNFIANGIVTHNCIYTWRGAHLDNLLSFETEFPGTKVVLLERNYRSTQTILTAANNVIAKNVKRKEKKLFTKNDAGEPIALYSAYGEDDEARFVVERVSELISAGTQPRDIAVLYRANFQSRVLEQAFMYAGVPYQVLGTRFFDRKEVKDVLSYIRAALNPQSQGDIARIVSTPPRGIGKMTLAKMLEGREHELTPAAAQKVHALRDELSTIRDAALHQKPSETIRVAVHTSGLEAKLKGGTEEERERLENIKELATLATKYDALEPEEGIQRLLEDAALATDQDSLETNHNAVKLMTVHASKGLEFDHVFIVGLEEGLFPHEKLDENADEEEERRLFYVALTRARKRVFLSHAVVRTIFGSQSIQTASSFIEDIGDDLIEVVGEHTPPHDRTVDLIDF